MKQLVYHEINPNSWKDVQQEGIRRSSRGDKSKDSLLQKTDRFLDTHRPHSIISLGLSRENNLYAYLTNEGKIIDITDGKSISVQSFNERGDQLLLQLSIDPDKCFVSDLDLYDTVKRSLELDEQDSTRETLAGHYWAKLVRLSDYQPGMIRRPEVIITYDVLPRDIKSMN